MAESRPGEQRAQDCARKSVRGTIDRLTIKLDRPQLTPEDIEKLRAAAPGASNKSSE